jgi:hypothetical protein
LEALPDEIGGTLWLIMPARMSDAIMSHTRSDAPAGPCELINVDRWTTLTHVTLAKPPLALVAGSGWRQGDRPDPASQFGDVTGSWLAEPRDDHHGSWAGGPDPYGAGPPQEVAATNETIFPWADQDAQLDGVARPDWRAEPAPPFPNLNDNQPASAAVSATAEPEGLSVERPGNARPLGNQEWLDDEHIRADYSHLRSELGRDNPDLARQIRLVDPAVAQLLRFAGDELQRDQATRFCDENGQDTVNFVFLPVNNADAASAGSHWSLLFIDRRDRQAPTAYHYDAIRGRPQWDIANDLAGQMGATQIGQPQLAQQTNGYDCGVSVLAATRELVFRMARGQAPDPDMLNLSGLVADRREVQIRLGGQPGDITPAAANTSPVMPLEQQPSPDPMMVDPSAMVDETEAPIGPGQFKRRSPMPPDARERLARLFTEQSKRKDPDGRTWTHEKIAAEANTKNSDATGILREYKLEKREITPREVSEFINEPNRRKVSLSTRVWGAIDKEFQRYNQLSVPKAAIKLNVDEDVRKILGGLGHAGHIFTARQVEYARKLRQPGTGQAAYALAPVPRGRLIDLFLSQKKSGKNDKEILADANKLGSEAKKILTEYKCEHYEITYQTVRNFSKLRPSKQRPPLSDPTWQAIDAAVFFKYKDLPTKKAIADFLNGDGDVQRILDEYGHPGRIFDRNEIHFRRQKKRKRTDPVGPCCTEHVSNE